MSLELPYPQTSQFYAVINADVVHMQPFVVETTELVASSLISKMTIGTYEILMTFV
jgi:hypothetical protein